MKRFLMTALLISAIPAVAVGQTVLSCEDCSHVASVYMGEGGFIATADDADMVTWVATCGGVTRIGELEPNDDGVVAALWSGTTTCMAEGGEFQIGPVMDGGWFWVTDDTNSAVGGLVSKDVLDNDAAEITKAGDGVTMMDGKGAVFLKETSTGRIGILPNILPMPEMDPVPVNRCSYTTAGATHTRETSGCMLGDGGTTIRAQGAADPYTGKQTPIMEGGMVTRPRAGDGIAITVDLWGNGTGHFTTESDPAARNGDPRLGHPGGTAFTAAFSGTYNAVGGVGGADIPGEPGAATTEAVGFVDNGGTSGTLRVAPSTQYCGTATKPLNHALKVTISAAVADEAAAAVVTPAIVGANGKAVAAANLTVSTLSFTVVCPAAAAAANQGQELVPENLFPISE